MAHQSELFDIFGYVFRLLRNTESPQSRANICSEVINFLEMLKNQEIEVSFQNVDLTRDFFSWLSLEIVNVLYDVDLKTSSAAVLEEFLQMLEVHASRDPFLLTGIINIFIESLSNTCGRGSYYKRKDPLFAVKRFDFADSPMDSDVIKSITVDDEIEMAPCYSFFVSIVDRCFNTIVKLDQTYSFNVLDVLLKMREFGSEDLKSTVLLLVPRFIISVQPTDFWEWERIHASFYIFYSLIKQPNQLTSVHYDALLESINHIVLEISGFDESLAKLMFVLSLEIPFALKKPKEIVSKWVDLSVAILGCLDLVTADFERAITQLVDPDCFEFLPLVESYIVKSCDSMNIDENGKTKVVVLEKKSSVWKACLEVLGGAPKVSYSGDFFVKLLNYSSQMVCAGRRIAYILNFKLGLKFELFGPRCLRALSSVPFMCHECLSDFCPEKYQSLVGYITSLLGLFAHLESSKLEDSYLLEHILVIFTLPWNKRCTTELSPDLHKLCLEGLINLTYIVPHEKCKLIVSVLINTVSSKIDSQEKEVLKKYLSLMILLLFQVPNDQVHDVMCILKSYLAQEKFELLLFNEFIDFKLPCFFANRCVARNSPSGWKLACCDCDAEPGEPVRFAMCAFSEYAALSFIDYLENRLSGEVDFAKCFLRFVNHSAVVREPQVIKKFFMAYLNRKPTDEAVVNEIILRLCYTNGKINKRAVMTIYSALCDFLKLLTVDESDDLADSLIPAVEILKRLLRLPVPSLMMILKILMTYYHSGGVSLCGIRGLFNIALSSRDMDCAQFCKSYEAQLSTFIVEFVLFKARGNPQNLSFFFVEFINVLGFRIDSAFISSSLMSSVLVDIIKSCDARTSLYVISRISHLFLMEPNELIEKHFDDIFAEIYALEDGNTAVEVLMPLLDHCKIDFDSLINRNYSQLVCKLILNSKHPLKIIRFLFQSKDIGVENVENHLNVLKQHFIGSLTVIESTLTSASSTSLHTAKTYIKCISTFIKMLGCKIVTEIQAKLLTTLRSCLPHFYDTFPKHCLAAWADFCYSVDPKKIGPYVPTILVHMLPLLEKFPEAVSNIFHFFVVGHGQHFREQLPLLHFVPCYPNVKMQQVWCVIQSSLLGKGDLNRKIVSTLENIYSESTETKIVALQYLRMCLKDNASCWIDSMKNSDTIDPIFETIFTCLLDNITHKNNDVKTLCGCCLGELGAVDPMTFGYNDAHKSYSPQKYDLTADDFSVLCITKIVHCLGKYDCQTTVVLYSTIQELLRLQLMEKNEMNKFKYFSKFSQQDQFILQPLLQTKYIFKGIKLEKNGSYSAAFGHHTTKTPCEWAALWASQILARMPPSFAKTVFSTCLPAMQIDSEVMETVLPYILLYALLYCDNSDLDWIEQEMKYILHWDLSKHRTKLDDCMIIIGKSERSVIHSDVIQTKYVSIILDLLDFVNQVVSDCYFFEAFLDIPNEEQIDTKIQRFLDRFCPNAMSWKSFMQKDPCRSLYYFEKASVNEDNVTNLKPLRNIYTKMNDIDGLLGVAKSSTKTPTAEETVVNLMVHGAIQDGLSWYERLCDKYKSTNTYRCLIQSYLSINQPNAALALSKQIIDGDKYLKPDIFSEHIEALWNAKHFDDTDQLFNELDAEFFKGHSWSVDLVAIHRLMRKPDYSNVLEKIQSIRLDVVNRLCDLNRTGMTLYRQGYWYMVKLHILNDIESLSDILFSVPSKGGKHEGFKEAWNYFDLRKGILPSHGPYVQDIRKTHLQTLDVVYDASKEKLSNEEGVNFAHHLGMLWLDSAKKARKNKLFQDAYSCIGIAEKFNPPKLFIELAKYYQAKFDTDSAVLVLQQGLNDNPRLTSAARESEECLIYAKTKLLTASFNVSSMNLDFNDGYTAFREAAEICNMEKSFVCLASYLYNQHLGEVEPDNTAAKRFIQLDSARNFSKSLLYGTKFIYQSMPSILSLWLDYGARIAKKLAIQKKADETGMVKTLTDFNILMENNLNRLPSYMFMTAFSQILSRINHRQQSCFDILKNIIAQIIQDYPQQAMWSFIAVCRSSNAMQRKRTEDICKRIKSSNKDLAKFFKVFNEFTEKLIDVALKKLKYKKHTPLTQLNPHLRPLILGCKSVPIMLPLQRLLTVHVGTSKTGDTQHVPYPLTPVYIVDVKEDVLMLYSIQMPKRLEFVGSDGEVYPLMCKKDDLRLDARIMEFNSIINSLLRRDPVAKEKDLFIRTYSVVPLNSECGIIEWLSGLLPLKGIITDMYAKLGVPQMPLSQIKKLMLVSKDECDIAERLRRFVEVILPKHPSVLHKWYFDRHPSPEEWYHCRNAFVKSSAVMSMVGYIVGLGDRHTENILIDSKTGEAVHVDFNCLFNRADLLMYPETVPFRLTHTMVRAMGATGVEGLFVISCEVAIRVMRHHKEQLLSIMKPFLYDMDVKTNNPRKRDAADDQANEEAKTNILNVEMRLNGVVRSKSDQYAPHRNSKPLSVEGQTRMLIKEATSNHNLCQMFAGWAPYI